MDVSLKKANEHRNAWFEGVQKCSLDENLFTVMERIVRAEVHRLVVVDENDKVIGIISLSDILLYLVLRPSGEGVGGTDQSVRVKITRQRTTSNTDDDDLSIRSISHHSIDNIVEEDQLDVKTVGNNDTDDERENNCNALSQQQQQQEQHSKIKSSSNASPPLINKSIVEDDGGGGGGGGGSSHENGKNVTNGDEDNDYSNKSDASISAGGGADELSSLSINEEVNNIRDSISVN